MEWWSGHLKLNLDSNHNKHSDILIWNIFHWNFIGGEKKSTIPSDLHRRQKESQWREWFCLKMSATFFSTHLRIDSTRKKIPTQKNPFFHFILLLVPFLEPFLIWCPDLPISHSRSSSCCTVVETCLVNKRSWVWIQPGAGLSFALSIISILEQVPQEGVPFMRLDA